MILFDASALLATAEPQSPHHEASRALLRSGRDCCTIDLALYEITNTTSLRWDDAAAGQLIRRRIWEMERVGRLVRATEPLMAAAAELTATHPRLTAYDAAYVAASRQLGATLVSCDVKDLVAPGFAVLPGDAGAAPTP